MIAPAGATRLLIGFALVVLVATIAAAAPILAPYDPMKSSLSLLAPPSWLNWFGTDELGRDIWSRLLYGARPSLLIGFGAASVAALIGVPIGLTAGYFRGIVDTAIVPVIDLFIAMPGLVLALIITVMVGPTIANLVLVLGFVGWPTVARLVRGQVLAIREQTFIEAARAIGGGGAWIIFRHVWPNVMRIVAAQFSITMSFAIFTSASLSFLGLGIPPPTPDWGGMVRAGFDFLSINPMMSLGPGAAVAVTVLGFYLIGTSVE